jgi:hypothetical protein
MIPAHVRPGRKPSSRPGVPCCPSTHPSTTGPGGPDASRLRGACARRARWPPHPTPWRAPTPSGVLLKVAQPPQLPLQLTTHQPTNRPTRSSSGMLKLSTRSIVLPLLDSIWSSFWAWTTVLRLGRLGRLGWLKVWEGTEWAVGHLERLEVGRRGKGVQQGGVGRGVQAGWAASGRASGPGRPCCGWSS